MDEKLYENLMEINKNIANICHFEVSDFNLKYNDDSNKNTNRSNQDFLNKKT